MNRCTYLLPIRRRAFASAEAAEFTCYFARLDAAGCEVLVIDGSPANVFEQHAAAWRGACRHAPVDSRFRYLNDKVNGIHTGVQLASCEKIILADDDIRYAGAGVDVVCALLEENAVVRPQNFLAPLPWWALMEAARMLINRATLRAADYPGTCAFGRSTILRCGHYDGDVLFDNEEIIRHFARSGVAICYAKDLFVEKRAPRLRKWIEQRPRQAYEDFGLRWKTTIFAALLPLALIASAFGYLRIYFNTVVLLSLLLCFRGWRRGNATKYFPFTAVLAAPLWIFERSISTYWAFGWFLFRGGYPFGDRLLSKGIGRDWVAGGRAAFAAGREPNEKP